MSSSIVYPHGTDTIVVPATESVAVYHTGDQGGEVFLQVGFPQHPDTFTSQGTVVNDQVIFGPFTDESTLRIEAQADELRYEIGSDPVVEETLSWQLQGDPTAETVAVTLTAADLLSQIITGTHAEGSTETYTFPTGTLMDAASEFDIGDSFKWYLLNESAAAADTITVAAGAGHTLVGNAIVQSRHVTTGGVTGSAGAFLTRKTAANTFITYRIT